MNKIFNEQLFLERRNFAAQSELFQDWIIIRCAEEIALRAKELNLQKELSLDHGSRSGYLKKLLLGFDIVNSDPSFMFLKNTAENMVVSSLESLPFAKMVFSNVFSILNIHNVNEIPNLFKNIYNSLLPSGYFLGCLFGERTFNTFKKVFMDTEIEMSLPSAPHFSPTIDIKTLGMLLQSSGFKNVVIDVDNIIIEHQSLSSLLRDIKFMGEGNFLVQKFFKFYNKSFYQKLENNLKSSYGHIKTEVDILYFVGQKQTKRCTI